MVQPVRLAPLRQPPVVFRSLEDPIAPLGGADGVATMVWCSADDVVVAHPRRATRAGLRRRPHRGRSRADLGDDVVDLDDVVAAAARSGIGEVLAHVGDPVVLDVLAARPERPSGLWLAHPDVDTLVAHRQALHDTRLVHVSRSAALGAPERHVAALARHGIDAVALPWTDWSAGLVALVHRFERYAVATDVTFDRHAATVMPMGVDAVTISGTLARPPAR